MGRRLVKETPDYKCVYDYTWEDYMVIPKNPNLTKAQKEERTSHHYSDKQDALDTMTTMQKCMEIVF